MQLGNFTIWCSSKRARELGATHHARMYGLIGGFWGEEHNVWIMRSDLLIPLEEALSWMWAFTCWCRGQEPDFMFEILREIEE